MFLLLCLFPFSFDFKSVAFLEHVDCPFEYVENSKQIQRVSVLLVNVQMQASATSLPAELSRVNFHLSHFYRMSFLIRFRFSKASTPQRMEENFVLAYSHLLSTIASLRSATVGKMQAILSQ